MNITRVIGREIFDSRGFPTIECEIALEENISVKASVPSSIVNEPGAVNDLRDGGTHIFGRGVSKAVEKLETVIAPHLVEKEPSLVEMDLLMIEIDGTPNKSNLGSNTMLAVSSALAKAQAIVEGLEPFELIAHLCDQNNVSIPFPLFTLVDGGMHADTNLKLQELMIVPTGAQSFRESMNLAVTIYHTLRAMLYKKGLRVATGDTGGFAPEISDVNEILDLVMEAIEMNGARDDVSLALDIAASDLYDTKTLTYSWQNSEYSTEGMIAWYEKLVASYPIYSIEDGLAQSDSAGWQQLTKTLGESTYIVGDALFSSNPYSISEGIEQQLATGSIIKPAQIGTLTEALQSINLCREHGMIPIISHCAGETNNSLIVDIAVGTSAGHFKAGAPCHGERVAKYNRLLRIEDSLMFSLLTA